MYNIKDMLNAGLQSRSLLVLLALFSGLHAQAQQTRKPYSVISQQNVNFIESTNMQRGGVSESQLDTLSVKSAAQTIQYFDGLGRPIQTVSVNNSPLQQDVVEAKSYDPAGREAIKYLPYIQGSNGLYKSNFLTPDVVGYSASPQAQFYLNTPRVAQTTQPYSVTQFEASPLSRPFKQGAPGEDWQPNATSFSTATDRATAYSYELNGSNEVLLWTYIEGSGSQPGTVSSGTSTQRTFYNPRTLFKNRVKDEQHNEIIEYVDMEGRTVLKRVQVVPGNVAINDTNYASTYYVYDEIGNLVVVLPPEAVRSLLSSTNY